MGDLIDFSIIEGQKENIQSLPHGRSARTLANLYSVSPLQPLSTPTPSMTTNLNDEMRREYEAEVANLAESDDPLDVYDRYVKWNMNAYPSAQATKESQLLPLLERATKTFLKDTQYKNDPRYLKLWLLYIKMFSDAPRETFAFLARHNIGAELALFYEEFAAWLEGSSRWTQAEEIYELGLQREARPVARLMRKHKEFQQRQAHHAQDDDGPASPALPPVRIALTAKIDPFATTAVSPSDRQSTQCTTGRSTKAKSAKPKMQIFADTEDASTALLGSDPLKGWDSIGSLAERRKENAIEPKPWAGETLRVGGKKSSTPKMAVFKDTTSRMQINTHKIVPHKEQVTMNERTKKQERIFVNLEAIYPTPDVVGTEMSFEELRAQNRGWLTQKWSREQIVEATCSSSEKITVLGEVNDTALNRVSKNAVLSALECAQLKPKKASQIEVFKEDARETSASATTPLLAPAEDNINGLLTASSTTQTICYNGKIPQPKPLKPKKMEIFADPEPIPNANDQPIIKPITGSTFIDGESNNPQIIMLDENGAVKVPLKEGRSRKLRSIEVNETQIIKTKLSSPSGNKKVKRKKNAEPTMTFHTKAATDEIYDLFSQPLTCGTTQENENEESNDDEDDDETDEDYTSGGESTGTIRLIGTDVEDNNHDDCDVEDVDDDDADDDDADDDDARSVSEWSDFTGSKYMPNKDEQEAGDTRVSRLSQEEDRDADDESDNDGYKSNRSLSRTSFIPIPPEDYVAPTRPFRNAEECQQNRLPFMTPIAEKTESSLGALTNRGEKDYLNSKTPSKENHMYTHRNGDLNSSPFHEDPVDKHNIKIAQPDLGLAARTKKSVLAVSRTKPVQEMSGGPIIKDTQCNPVDDFTRNQILEKLQPSLTVYRGYYDHKTETFNKGAELRKFCKALTKINKGGNDKTSTNITMAPILTFPEIRNQYIVKRELGAGAYAPVFLLEQESSVTNDDHPRLAKSRPNLLALKMENPPTPWEYHITRTAKERLTSTRAAKSVIDVYEMHLYADEGYLIEEYRDQGTLLDLVNIARADSSQPNGVMDEIVVMFFTVELLRTIETLHTSGILHGDLKADNCLVRLDPVVESSIWQTRYDHSGLGGWSEKGICLIDFGRGIDMRNFVPDVQFIADWKTGPQDCAEMRELRPWTYQIDYHGLAGIIHSLLFGKYIDTVADKASGLGSIKTYKIKESLKRYWQTELWAECFDLLLNPTTKVEVEIGRCMPITIGLRSIRTKMEEWIEINCDRGIGLQAMIRKLEYGIAARRK